MRRPPRRSGSSEVAPRRPRAAAACRIQSRSRHRRWRPAIPRSAAATRRRRTRCRTARRALSSPPASRRPARRRRHPGAGMQACANAGRRQACDSSTRAQPNITFSTSERSSNSACAIANCRSGPLSTSSNTRSLSWSKTSAFVTRSPSEKRAVFSHSSATPGFVRIVHSCWRCTRNSRYSGLPGPASTSVTSAVAPSASTKKPAPTVSPMAATIQMVAADVRPVMPPLDCMIVPAPMNPMPVTTWAAMRPGSPTRTSPKAIPRFIERSMINAEPRQIRIFVRTPEAFPAICRSKPIAPPMSTASASLIARSSRNTLTMSDAEDNSGAAKITLASVGSEWEPHQLLHLQDRLPGHGTRLGGTGLERFRHARRVRPQLAGSLTDRCEFVHEVREERLLAVDAAPRRRAAVRLHLAHRRLGGERLVQLIDRRAFLRIALVGLSLARGIRHGGAQLLPDRVRLLEKSDRVAERFRHLRLPVEPDNPARGRETRLRLRKVRRLRREAAVPVACDDPRQLEVLDLVFAHGNEVRVVEQDVRRLQDGVIEDPRHHLLLLRRLLLERNLPLELAERRDRVENPRELGMLGHLRLDEQGRLRRVDPGGEEPHRHFLRAPLQFPRLVGRRNGVVVHDAEERLELVLQLHPVLHRPEVVS